MGLLLAASALVLLALLARPPGPDAVVAGPVPRVDGPEGDADREGYAVWGRDGQGAPLRWDACAPVPFVLNGDGAPPGAADDVRAALSRLADASGLDLVLLGTTEERPSRDRPLVERDGSGWRWRPVLVAWTAPGEGGLPLTPLDRGVALPVAVRDGDRESFVTGQVVLNVRRADLAPGFGDRADALGALLLHELAHVLGLDHVDDPGELMWDRPGEGPVTLGPGDRAGLRAIGADAGCRPSPDPAAGRGLAVDR